MVCKPASLLLRTQVTLAASCLLGLSINHSTFVCTRYNDALTTSVAGSIKVPACCARLPLASPAAAHFTKECKRCCCKCLQLLLHCSNAGSAVGACISLH